MTKTITLYTPPDLDEAHQRWGCNCGPGALAAALHVPCETVRPWFEGFERRRYVNPTHMERAIVAAGHGYWPLVERDEFPSYGVEFLQVTGPWTKPGVPIAAAYRHTHWIASAYIDGHWWVFDVNAREWLTFKAWSCDIMPAILEAAKGATGWFTRKGICLDPPASTESKGVRS